MEAAIAPVSHIAEEGDMNSTSATGSFRGENTVQVSPMVLAVTSGVLWGGFTLVIGLMNLAVPSYAADYLRLMSSFHPGLSLPGSPGNTLAGAAAGITDGLIAGYLFGWIYNKLMDLLAAEPKLKAPPLSRGI